MPKVVTVSNEAKWKSAEVVGSIGNNEFSYLGTFEEILPDHQEYSLGRSKKNNKNIEVLKREKSKIDENYCAPKTKDKHENNRGKFCEEKKSMKKKIKRASDEFLISGKKKKRRVVSEKDDVIIYSHLSTSSTASKSTTCDEKKVVGNVHSTEDDEDISANVENWKEYYLPYPILRSIKDMGFESPTEIQRRVLPIAVRDRCDVLGAAETGSGKTLAYGIPITVRLLEMSEDFRSSKTGPKALILAPTRELVMQVMKHVTVLLKYTDFKAFPIVGGLAQVRQARILNKLKPEVIVATPGRLWAMMKDPVDEEPGCQYLSDWAGLLCLVIDETDRMVEKGHFHELEDILKRVRKCCSEKLQTLVFSATLTYVHYNRASDGRTSTEHNLQKKLKQLIHLTRMRSHCKIVDITRAFGTAEALVETRINCSDLLEKDTTVVYLLERYKGRTLIFTNSIDASRRVYGILKLLKFRPLMIHAKMEQKIRLKNLENFTADPRGILLATDVAARGLDIQCIDNVIHYQVPKTAEIYIHRSGRTARASRKGLSVLIVDLKDSHLYKKLCKNLNREKDLPVFPIDCPDLMKHLVIRVKLASALDSLAHKKKKIHLSENWFSKVLRDAELEMDDARQSEQASSNAAMDLIRAEETRLQAELKAELAAPLPSLDRMDLPKTRYINSDIIARYEKAINKSVNTLDDIEEKLAEVENLKKRARKFISTRQLRVKVYRNKKRRKRLR